MNPPEGEAKIEDKPAAVESEVVKAPAKRGRKKAMTVADTPVAAKVPAKRGRKKAVPVAETAASETSKAAAPVDVPVAAGKVTVQFSGKSYSTEDLVKIAKDIWVYDLGKDEADFKSVELYVKTEESTVYYVINDEVQGSYSI